MTTALEAPTGSSECLHCGAYVTDRFRRVFGDDDDRAHRCSDCDCYRRLSRGSAAGVDVDGHPDPETTDGHHGGEPQVRADGRGQLTIAGWIALTGVLAALVVLTFAVVMVA